MPNIFVRVGLFILTCIIIGFADSLLSLMASSSHLITTAGWVFFLAILSYVALEVIVNNGHYRSGVDDALLIIAAGQLIATFGMMLYSIDGFLLCLSALAFILFIFLSLRFADMLTSAACCISFFAMVYFACEKIGSIGLTVVPFIMMLASGLVYWLVYACCNKKEFANYRNCLVIIQIVCLLTLYAAGNYYVVQTLSDELHGQTKAISLGAFFWTWTIVLPFVYIWFGIKKKNVILLRIGLSLVAAAAVTFRTYYHIFPLDVTLTVVAAIILGVVYLVTKYLKTPKHGFTLAEPTETHLMDNLKIESLAVAQTFSHAPSAPADKGTKFDGGDFGGGGSSDSF